MGRQDALAHVVEVAEEEVHLQRKLISWSMRTKEEKQARNDELEVWSLDPPDGGGRRRRRTIQRGMKRQRRNEEAAET